MQENCKKLAILPGTIHRLQHDTSTTWFQTSRYCRAKVELSSARQ